MDLKASRQLFFQFGFPLALIAAFCVPLKLSFAYASLVPLIVLWFLSLPGRSVSIPGLMKPLFIFIIIALISSLFGIHPFRSLPKFINLTFFCCAALMFAEIGRKHGIERLLGISLLGQSLACLRVVLDGISPGTIPRVFLGAVTQSGQLAIQIPIAIGLAFVLLTPTLAEKGRDLSSRARATILMLGSATLVLCTILGLSSTLALSAPLRGTLAVGVAALILGTLWQGRRHGDFYAALLVGGILPLLIATLLINMKRGPWLGVFVGSSIFLIIYARRWVVPALIAALTTVLMVEPLRERLALSTQHFFITGGRNIMWKIGAELATRYPLGIGFHNSPFLRNFSVEIPPQHNHFHNNILNILVETGWLGLTAFLWWLYGIIRVSFLSFTWSRRDILATAIGCAIISWQTAGLVEYNFGDSEVVNLAWLSIGGLLSLQAESTRSAPFTQPSHDSDIIVNATL